MNKFFLVASGGAIGAISRYALAEYVQRLSFSSFPYGTLAVNVIGCLIIGALWAWVERYQISPATIALLFAGFLGSFTTFSTFGLETMTLIKDGNTGMAVANVAISNIGGIGAAFIGYFLGKILLGSTDISTVG